MYGNDNPIKYIDPSGRSADLSLPGLLGGLEVQKVLEFTAITVGAVAVGLGLNIIRRNFQNSLTDWEGTLTTNSFGLPGGLLGFDPNFGPGASISVLRLRSTNRNLQGSWLIIGADYGVGFFASSTRGSVKAISRSLVGPASLNDLTGVFASGGVGISLPGLPELEGGITLFGIAGGGIARGFSVDGESVGYEYGGGISTGISILASTSF